MIDKEIYSQQLSDPNLFNDPVSLDGLSEKILLSSLKSMTYIRLTEHKLAEEKKNANIIGPVHLGAGQEAIAVGISSALKKTDRVFGAHRSHSHLLALNPNSYKLFAEVLGKDTGFSKGMGGSMHLWDQPNGFYGSVPIVAGTVPLAVGAGLAAKMQDGDDIAVAYIGDGAIEEGIVSESLNLASTLDIPILFVIENNLFSSHMHISLRQPKISTSRFAEANNIASIVVDGNNICEVTNAADNFINEMRNSRSPKFIEAITYRHYGHVDWREDSDVGVNRSQKDIQLWKKRDPITRLSAALIQAEIIDKQYLEDINNEIILELNKSWKQALLDPYPEPNTLLERVYDQ